MKISRNNHIFFFSIIFLSFSFCENLEMKRDIFREIIEDFNDIKIIVDKKMDEKLSNKNDWWKRIKVDLLEIQKNINKSQISSNYIFVQGKIMEIILEMKIFINSILEDEEKDLMLKICLNLNRRVNLMEK